MQRASYLGATAGQRATPSHREVQRRGRRPGQATRKYHNSERQTRDVCLGQDLFRGGVLGHGKELPGA